MNEETELTKQKLPYIGLLSLSMVAFNAIITELLPPGVLLSMSKDLEVSQASVGQLVSCYAIGSVLTAIPGSAVTAHLSRKPLLNKLLIGFFLVNLITAISTNFIITLLVRIIAGAIAGLAWPLVTAYATKMVNLAYTGKALSIVLAGSTLALSLGLPLGTFIGDKFGWEAAFYSLSSALSIVVIAFSVQTLPDFPGEKKGSAMPFTQVIALPGISYILLSMFVSVVATYCSYTYISPILSDQGIQNGPGFSLFLFGLGAVVGILFVGQLIDKFLRSPLLSALSFMGVVYLIFSISKDSDNIIYATMFLWGIAFGALPTLLQTAIIRAAGKASDSATAIFVTLYNVGIFSGLLAGGLIMDSLGVKLLSASSLAICVSSLVMVFAGKRCAFPSYR